MPRRYATPPTAYTLPYRRFKHYRFAVTMMTELEVATSCRFESKQSNIEVSPRDRRRIPLDLLQQIGDPWARRGRTGGTSGSGRAGRRAREAWEPVCPPAQGRGAEGGGRVATSHQSRTATKRRSAACEKRVPRRPRTPRARDLRCCRSRALLQRRMGDSNPRGCYPNTLSKWLEGCWAGAGGCVWAGQRRARTEAVPAGGVGPETNCYRNCYPAGGS